MKPVKDQIVIKSSSPLRSLSLSLSESLSLSRNRARKNDREIFSNFDLDFSHRIVLEAMSRTFRYRSHSTTWKDVSIAEYRANVYYHRETRIRYRTDLLTFKLFLRKNSHFHEERGDFFSLGYNFRTIMSFFRFRSVLELFYDENCSRDISLPTNFSYLPTFSSPLEKYRLR